MIVGMGITFVEYVMSDMISIGVFQSEQGCFGQSCSNPLFPFFPLNI